MLVSYNWIQKEYFKDKLPNPQDLVSILTHHAFEIEQIEKKGDDYLIDVDILPNRAHDCLSHRGIAREIRVILDKQISEKKFSIPSNSPQLDDKLSVAVDAPNLCPRYIGRYVRGVSVGESPEWLRHKIESIGQRSINNIVDITNYILFDLGQPLHVFDADKLEGGAIIVRQSREGERITTLDGEDIKLTTGTLVIADDKDPLAIAGIKGGTKAEVDRNTKNIVIEAANFLPINIRKTAQRVGIRTESSTRYEHEITSELASEGMAIATALITEIAGNSNTMIGAPKDIYTTKEDQKTVTVSLEKINSVLGITLLQKEVEDIFTRFNFEYSTTENKTENSVSFIVTIPYERLDLRIAEDLVEEVGRIYGYQHISDVLPNDIDFSPKINKLFYYTGVIRTALIDEGFSEVETYTFTNQGEVEIANPLASDKNFMRSSLLKGLSASLELNAKNLAVVGISNVCVFEIGIVFEQAGEHTSLGMAFRNPKVKVTKAKEKEFIENTLKILTDKFGVIFSGVITELPDGGAVVEINLDQLIEKLPEPKSYDQILYTTTQAIKYKSFSVYPFIVRDIAVFVPENTNKEKIEEILKKNGGELVVREPELFDTFTKTFDNGEKKTSYAYKLVFQSHKRTLTDLEIGKIMETISVALHQNTGWEVR